MTTKGSEVRSLHSMAQKIIFDKAPKKFIILFYMFMCQQARFSDTKAD